jgi:hypothetical protein
VKTLWAALGQKMSNMLSAMEDAVSASFQLSFSVHFDELQYCFNGKTS